MLIYRCAQVTKTHPASSNVVFISMCTYERYYRLTERCAFVRFKPIVTSRRRAASSSCDIKRREDEEEEENEKEKEKKEICAFLSNRIFSSADFDVYTRSFPLHYFSTEDSSYRINTLIFSYSIRTLFLVYVSIFSLPYQRRSSLLVVHK